jgi:hypothetical protein
MLWLTTWLSFFTGTDNGKRQEQHMNNQFKYEYERDGYRRSLCSLTIIKSRTNQTKMFSDDTPKTFLSLHQMLETNRRRIRSAYSDWDCVWQKKAHIWDCFQTLSIFRRVKASLPISLCAKPTLHHATDTKFCCVQLKTDIY